VGKLTIYDTFSASFPALLYISAKSKYQLPVNVGHL